MPEGPIKATGADTAGIYAVVELSAPPDEVPPPRHLHRRTTEAFYVLEGALSIALDDREVGAEEGDFVTVAPGVVHTFSVRGTVPARFLVIVSPPEFIGFFAQMLGTPSAEHPGPYDIEVVEGGRWGSAYGHGSYCSFLK